MVSTSLEVDAFSGKSNTSKWEVIFLALMLAYTSRTLPKAIRPGFSGSTPIGVDATFREASAEVSCRGEWYSESINAARFSCKYAGRVMIDGSVSTFAMRVPSFLGRRSPVQLCVLQEPHNKLFKSTQVHQMEIAPKLSPPATTRR